MASSARAHAGSRMREFELIRALKARHGASHPSIIRGIGDDAAVIAWDRNRYQVVTTDLLAEGVHFDRGTADFGDIGFRAATANLSDIAAMGGAPKYLLVSLAIPGDAIGRQVTQFYDGLMAASRIHNVKLIGGDTSASKDGWFVNITLIGSVRSGHVLFRSGARPGDDLYVTGTLGDSRVGLELLQRPRRAPRLRSLTPRLQWFLTQRHLRPTARVREGRWLSAVPWATSAIDLSDGLSGDLRHLCTASRVGAVIELSALPISPACRDYASAVKRDPSAFALAGGEDYELLFTVPTRHRIRFERASRRERMRMTRVGKITPLKDGLRMVLPDGRQRPLPVASYEHFRPSP
jgi:thiamine-monophosphate kinase